jgi:hypothetical protein
MKINVIYDSDVSAANFTSAGEEAAFKNAVAFVVNEYEHLFTNNVTLDLNVGWTPLQPGLIGQSTSPRVDFTYSQVKIALTATANASGDPAQLAAVATLPASDPVGGNTLDLTSVEAAAIGAAAGDKPGHGPHLHCQQCVLVFHPDGHARRWGVLHHRRHRT